MTQPCGGCAKTFEGLAYFIPDEAFALVEHLGPQPCPWCVNEVLASHDLRVRAHVQIALSHFHGINREVVKELELLDVRLMQGGKFEGI